MRSGYKGWRRRLVFATIAGTLVLMVTGPAFIRDTVRAQSDVTLTVSAASDLTPAFTELGALFEQETGVKVEFNFGSTGQLTEQIKAGAPVDVFAAANISYIDDLDAARLILS